MYRMKNSIFIVLILAMGALLFGCIGSNQNNTTGQTGSLHGKITDLNGVPLANVLVSATSGDLYYSVRTDSDGTYSISGMQPGKYSVDAIDLDYEFKAGEATIAKGESYVWSAALAPFGETGQEIPFGETGQNITVNDTPVVAEPEKAFVITNCTPITYDFYPGTEDSSAGLNCTFTPIDCSRGDSYDKWMRLTLFGPDGKEISNTTFCIDSSKMIRMTKKTWTTPDRGRYTLTAEMDDGSKRILYEYNMTFEGQRLTLVREIVYPPGDLEYDNRLKVYGCHSHPSGNPYDTELDYIGFKMRNDGDLPVFTDHIDATVDGKDVISGGRYINGDPGNGTTDKLNLLCSNLVAGSHTLNVKTYNKDNLISDDTLMFNIPR
jgi:hypothetical protein